MSRFVSAGELEKQTKRDDEWVKAQQEVEENRKRKAEAGRPAGGKSLYEVLQDNKAAKQEALEERLRLQNSIASLQEEDVEYLDAVLESERSKEAAVRRETSEQLALFRKHQEEAEREAIAKAGSPVEEQDTWTVSNKKRKKAPEKGSVLGVKLRKSSSSEAAHKNNEPNDAAVAVAARPASDGSPKRIHEEASSQDSSHKHTHPSPPSIAAAQPLSTQSPAAAGTTKVDSGDIETSNIKPISSPPKPSLGLGLDEYSSDDE